MSDVHMRRVEIQGEVFDGYSLWIDISKYTDIDDISAFCRTHLTNFLQTFNLKNLCHYANIMTLSNNLFTSCDDIIKNTREHDTIYLYENYKKIATINEESERY